MFPEGVWAFHNCKYLCPNSSQSTLLNILQLCGGVFNNQLYTNTNRVGIRLSYRPAGLHRLADLIPSNRCLGSIKVKKFGLCIPTNQLGQPHSQSLNKYFSKGIFILHSMAEKVSLSLQARWQQVISKKDAHSSFHQLQHVSSYQTHKSRTWE